MMDGALSPVGLLDRGMRVEDSIGMCYRRRSSGGCMERSFLLVFLLSFFDMGGFSVSSN